MQICKEEYREAKEKLRGLDKQIKLTCDEVDSYIITYCFDDKENSVTKIKGLLEEAILDETYKFRSKAKVLIEQVESSQAYREGFYD